MAHTCPVCGYPELFDPPRSPDGGGSYEICPCCGFQFGYDDDDQGHTYVEWRQHWRKRGMKWWSRSRLAPPDWDPAAQLAGAGISRSSRSSHKESDRE